MKECPIAQRDHAGFRFSVAITSEETPGAHDLTPVFRPAQYLNHSLIFVFCFTSKSVRKICLCFRACSLHVDEKPPTVEGTDKLMRRRLFAQVDCCSEIRRKAFSPSGMILLRLDRLEQFRRVEQADASGSQTFAESRLWEK
jgi:hypothetical protein